MSIAISVVKTIAEGATRISYSKAHAPQTVSKLVEDVDTGVTNGLYDLAIDISKLKVFAMSASQDMTVYTNDLGSGAPQETFVLVAGVPVIFEEGDTAIFAGDVTALYATNSSGTNGVLTVIAGTNS